MPVVKCIMLYRPGSRYSQEVVFLCPRNNHWSNRFTTNTVIPSRPICQRTQRKKRPLWERLQFIQWPGTLLFCIQRNHFNPPPSENQIFTSCAGLLVTFIDRWIYGDNVIDRTLKTSYKNIYIYVLLFRFTIMSCKWMHSVNNSVESLATTESTISFVHITHVVDDFALDTCSTGGCWLDIYPQFIVTSSLLD